MQIFDTAIVIFLGSLLLLIPLWVLQAMNDVKAVLGVISVFVLGFTILVHIITIARPYETLAATTGYLY